MGLRRDERKEIVKETRFSLVILIVLSMALASCGLKVVPKVAGDSCRLQRGWVVE